MLKIPVRRPGKVSALGWYRLFRNGLRAGSFLAALVFPNPIEAQDPLRFEREVRVLTETNESLWNPGKPALVFTGSSSIRLWTALPDRFPDHQIVNTGFGGSQASDLLYYLDALVLAYRPAKVFIYEGDNDLAEGKRPRRVVKDLREVATRIREKSPHTAIIFISAKPSPSRWRLRWRYRRFNRKLQRWTKKGDTLIFADVWHPMLQGRNVDASLFIEDGLHLNGKGYEIWFEVLRPLIENPTKNHKP